MNIDHYHRLPLGGPDEDGANKKLVVRMRDTDQAKLATIEEHIRVTQGRICIRRSDLLRFAIDRAVAEIQTNT